MKEGTLLAVHRASVTPVPVKRLFWSHTSTTDLCFCSRRPDICLSRETPDTRLVRWPFMPQLSLVLFVPASEGMMRLSSPGWLVTYRDGLPAQTVTHSSTKRARHGVTLSIETSVLPLSQTVSRYNVSKLTHTFIVSVHWLLIQ